MKVFWSDRPSLSAQPVFFMIKTTTATVMMMMVMMATMMTMMTMMTVMMTFTRRVHPHWCFGSMDLIGDGDNLAGY